MSDTPQGDGWWQTSDGKWHPPEYDPTAPGSDPTGSTPGLEAGSVPPPWSPSTGAATQPSADPEPQWGEDQPQWGDPPPTTDQPAPPTPFTTPPTAAPPPLSEPYDYGQPASPAQPHTPPGSPLFGDHDPQGTDTSTGTRASTDTTDESGPFGTMRPGEFGLPSEPERPPQPKIVRPAAIPGDVGLTSSRGSGPSPVLIWSGVAAAILLVLFAGWYFLLRDDGSGEKATDGAASNAEPTGEGGSAGSTDQSPTTEAPPTTDPLPTKPTIAPGARLSELEFNGTGTSTVAIDPPGPRVAKVDYPGTGPFALKSLDANGGEIATLVDAEGPYSGSVAVDFRDEQDSRSLSIEAAGSWSIRMLPVESLTALPGTFKGSGDNVVLYAGGVGPVKISHSGTGPFKVNSFEIRTRKISTIADEKGPYEGTVELRGPAFVWITADGDWSVTPG